MTLRTARRLPGIRFEVQPPPPRDILPRMDVAAFVGFAASGPLHFPVLIEDPAQFDAIFGRDLPLAWDERHGEQVYAFLGPTVRTFLRNGGKRCYVIRVADGETAQPNTFQLCGVARVTRRVDDTFTLTPAFAQARSEGSWSDGLRVATAMSVRAITVQSVTANTAPPYSMTLSVSASRPVIPGDLVRLTYKGAEGAPDRIVMLAVGSVRSPNNDSEGGMLEVSGSAAHFETLRPSSPPEEIMSVSVYTRGADGEPIPVLSDLAVNDDGEMSLYLNMALSEAPQPGETIRVETSSGVIWLTLQAVHDAEWVEALSPLTTHPAVHVIGTGLRWLNSPSSFDASPPTDASPPQPPVAEILRLHLLTRFGSGDPDQLNDLDFAPGGSRFWGSLPDDFRLYSESTERLPDALWHDAANPRFPLAGFDDNRGELSFTIPFGVGALPDYYLPPLTQTDYPLVRDGLAAFHPDVFLDEALAESLTYDLLAKANYIRYQSPNPRIHLKGIHAALAVEEITLIAVPDAVHPGWTLVTELVAQPPEVLSPPERPDWWRFEDCDTTPPTSPTPPRPIKRTSVPPWGNFLDCRIEVLDIPSLEVANAPDTTGTFTLSWDSTVVGGVYTLEEAINPDFSDAVILYRGTDKRLTLYGRNRGTYYYHVRVESGINVSDWSPGVTVSVGLQTRYTLNTPNPTRPNTDLLIIQRALLRLCAARGDLFAILGLPETNREAQAIAHVEALRPSAKANIPPGNLSLSYGERGLLSYGALYHPWIIGREDGSQALRRLPPDGTICAMFAKRALARGAWIAPANERLSDIVALTPAIPDERWPDLLEAGVNVIRSQPYGFVTLSADTLSDDPDLIPIGTRRLLILLRRLALQLGTRYVFEPNDEVFRRMVQRGFDDLLDSLFTRGAFAGRTASAAYQVVVHDTPQQIEQGQLIVDLKVAPALPMVFLTVRLVQSGERGLSFSEVR